MFHLIWNCVSKYFTCALTLEVDEVSDLEDDEKVINVNK